MDQQYHGALVEDSGLSMSLLFCLTCSSFQLEADIQTNGSTSGALVHFTEATMGPNLTATIPWIAYISCDQNETEASNEWGMSIMTF